MFNTNIRIAVVNGKIIFPHIGGAAKSMLAQSAELEKMGVIVKVVSGDSIDYINGFENINFAKLTQIGFDRLKNISFIKVFENWKQTLSLFIYIVINSFCLSLKRSDFDLINNQGYWTLRQDVLTMLFCMKKYASLTAPRSYKDRIINFIDLRFNLLLLVEKVYFKFKLYKKIAVNSEYTRRNVCEAYKIPFQDVQVIPDGYDDVFFKSDINSKDYLKSLSGFKNKTTIMWAGYNPARKNLSLFLEYLNLNPDVIGLIVGVDFNKASKYGVIGENVRIYGKIDHIEKIFARTDIFFFPTLYEGCAKVLLEAMISGCAVVTTHDSGADMYIKNNLNGYVLSNNKEDLFKCLDSLIADKSRVKMIGKNARKSAEMFTWENSARMYLDLYNLILSDEENS